MLFLVDNKNSGQYFSTIIPQYLNNYITKNLKGDLSGVDEINEQAKLSAVKKLTVYRKIVSCHNFSGLIYNENGTAFSYFIGSDSSLK